MHWLNYNLLATILWAAYSQNSVAQSESSSNMSEKCILKGDPKENEICQKPLPTDLIAKPGNNTGESDSGNVTTLHESLKSGQKLFVENITFNDIKPLLLFPISPYLFPPREEESLSSGKDEFSTSKNVTSKVVGNLTQMKPFIFFDFAFNIRRIPIRNTTDKLNDSKIINMKKLSVSKSEDSKKNRRRRNTKMETPGFFDDAPLFPDSELDEFLPKPDLFFPDLPFYHKAAKKLSRRKRDQKKTELRNDLKSFLDAFDEAFMRTKRELEWTDPTLNFLRGEQAFDEEKKEGDDLYDQPPDIKEKPSVKWRIQRNTKRLNNDRRLGLTKAQDSPTIIVDKVVKIGEFHVHDDVHDKNKKKKRGLIDSKRKFLGRDNDVEITNDDQNFPKSIFELMKQEGSKRKRRVHPKITNPEEEISEKIELKEVKSSTLMNESLPSTNVKRMSEQDKKNMGKYSSGTNSTEKLLDLIKIFENLKGKLEVELKNGFMLQEDNSKNVHSYNKMTGTKKMFQDDLKKNLTELLKQFLALNKNLAEPKSVVKTTLGERDDAEFYDWAEKETKQNVNNAGKGTRERRQKKERCNEKDDVNSGKNEKHIPNLTRSFLNMTLPTIFVFGVILVICFFLLQTKGRICTKLFSPRKVLVLNDGATAQLKNPRNRKTQAI